MAVQIVMDHTGDSRYEFSPQDQKALDEAEHRFMELTGQGFTAATRGEGKTTVTKNFNPEAEETIFIPRLKGG